MPPKGGRAKRAGSVSASAASLDDSKVVHASLTVDTAAIPEQGAAVSKHKVINNKSGAPAKIAATADLSYVATSSYMTPKGKAVDATPPGWMVYWFLISAFIMTWDAGFVLTREAYGQTAWHQAIWYPYHNLYVNVDKFYGSYGSDASPGYLAWAKSQTQMNVVEIVLQLGAALLSAAPIGTVIGLIVSVSTLIKTVLYMLMIVNSPDPSIVLPSIAMKSTQDMINFWVWFVGTNGWWIVIPALCVHSLSARLIAATQHS